jgi:hypothetical protein
MMAAVLNRGWPVRQFLGSVHAVAPVQQEKQFQMVR